MQNIIYKSENIIPWDTQSAFKMTSYNCSKEEHMVFCYLKAYVHKTDLVMCSYCFSENPKADKNIHLYINLAPENKENVLKIEYDLFGTGNMSFNGKQIESFSGIEYSSFRTDDEQGFYWCGETVLKAEAVKQLAGIVLEEKSVITLNMVQNFENGDFSVLCGDALSEKYNPVENMGVFVILDY